MEANDVEGIPAAAAAAAAAAPALTSPAFSDEAIAMLVALTGGDEASARALLEVRERKRERERESGIDKEGAPLLFAAVPTSSLISRSLSLLSPPLPPTLPIFLPPHNHRPPPATSSRPRTSSSPEASPP